MLIATGAPGLSGGNVAACGKGSDRTVKLNCGDSRNQIMDAMKDVTKWRLIMHRSERETKSVCIGYLPITYKTLGYGSISCVLLSSVVRPIESAVYSRAV